MIDITDKHDCCGCAACAQACPKQCITMQADSEGFLYPKVDGSLCIDCGLCEKVCHELHSYDEHRPQQVLAVVNKDEEVRMHSSSGGIFYILASKVIAEGGVVFGARFDNDWQVVIDYAETMDGIKAFMGSKYVQARTGTAFRDARRLLQDGRKVLFTGTPCQIAALRHYLRKDYENLTTVDFVCHGTPSPKVWQKYLDEVIKAGQRISSVEFRNKKKGWKQFCFHLQYNEDDATVSMLSPAGKNHFMKAFLKDVILRPSCYACKAKEGRSNSDLTIADFWGIEKVFPDMDDNKGTGMVFINTDKGAATLDYDKMTTRMTDYETVRPLNTASWRSSAPHPKRADFFDKLDSTESLITLINEITRPTFLQQCRQQASCAKHLLLKLIGGGNSEQTHKVITSLPIHPQIADISFRNKERGWRGYYMDIRVKETKQDAAQPLL